MKHKPWAQFIRLSDHGVDVTAAFLKLMQYSPTQVSPLLLRLPPTLFISMVRIM